MILKIVQAGDTALRTSAKAVTPEQLKTTKTQELIDLMISTLRDQPGVGLAAPQIGVAIQIIVIEDLAKYQEKVPKKLLEAQHREVIPFTVLVNPRLTVIDQTVCNFFEGCLSVEGYRAVVPRAFAVRVTALDRHGKPVSLEAKGWFARILQHEIDHLNGREFISHMIAHTFMTEQHFTRDWSEALPDKIASLLA